MEKAAQLGPQHIVEEAKGAEHKTDEDLLFQAGLDIEEDGTIDPHYPADHNGDGRVVDKDLEPTEGAGPARTGELLKIGEDAAGLVGERGQLAHGQASENNGNGGQSKDKSAQSHAAAGGHQHIVAFEKDA